MKATTILYLIILAAGTAFIFVVSDHPEIILGEKTLDVVISQK